MGLAFRNGLVVLAICLLGVGGRPVAADDGLYEQAMELISEGRYGEANAPVRLAAQAYLDRSLGEAITELNA